jgi:RNA-directed DNA polymerase
MWSPQRYLQQGKTKGVDAAVLAEAVKQIKRLNAHTPPLPTVLSLPHLACLSQTDWGVIRRYVTRENDDDYRRFYMKKRSGGYRRIGIPAEQLGRVQSWIAHNILARPAVHPASHAFRAGNSIVKCAAVHENAKWMIKIDIADFFGSITEIQVYRIFRSFGYNALVSFEMARICTDKLIKSAKYKLDSWKVREQERKIGDYNQKVLGRLPQGAPTSPMLSNFAMLDLDAQIAALAEGAGLRYTRYSDDMTFSTKDEFNRAAAVEFIAGVAGILKKKGLYLNRAKTKIVPPGARKVVLGLLASGDFPALSKAFKANLRQHIFYLEKYGIENHVQKREFDSIGGLYRHLLGLINFANMVDPTYADAIRAKFDALPWPGQSAVI